MTLLNDKEIGKDIVFWGKTAMLPKLVYVRIATEKLSVM